MSNRLELIRIFCVCAELQNFSKAAAHLGISPQVVTRAINELESTFGEPLFHRNTRKVNITSFGEGLARRAQVSLASIDDLFRSSAASSKMDMEGIVRLTAPAALGRRYLMPALTRLAVAHPGIILDVRLSDEIADVVDEQIDVGVRTGLMRDSRFVARAAGQGILSVVGSPELLARVGKPKTINALRQQPLTALLDRSTGRAWPWYFADGEQFQPSSSAFLTDDPEAELAAVLAGVGFGQLPSYLTAAEIENGRLIPVLQKSDPEPWKIYVYRPQRGPVPGRVRVVFDALVKALSELD
ncbi:LysR family transcriptional regulator [Paraherbaspirillum soli]|uniref:LysR family transcriptional regulator n=1 Tax=Paraherbaspirillum soli TaxID=631222 RepID=A0ABW0M8Q3_9BURK